MSTRPRLLDLFSGAGGAGMGYYRAGFDVTGVDIRPQPRYPFAFVQADALEYLMAHGRQYDVIHASPPCQAHTALRTMHNARRHLDLIAPTRDALRSIGRLYVIENVPGAPLKAPVLLCGTMFGLGIPGAELWRHRLFECSAPLMAPSCRHGREPDCIGLYGGHVRNRRRRTVAGRKVERGVADFSMEDGFRAMGIDWMNLRELCQAIPPAYTAWLGAQLLGVLSP